MSTPWTDACNNNFSHNDGKVTKKREQNKTNSFVFYAECSNFAIFNGRVTKKACKSEAIWED